MAITNAQVSVAGTATALGAAETDNQAGSVLYLNNTGATAVFLGGPTVTIANGYSLAAGALLRIADLGVGEVLYGICAVSGTVGVLRTGV